MRKTVIALLVIVAILGGIAVLRAPILEGKILDSLRPFYVLLFPPDDLYQPVARFIFDPKDERTIHTFIFTHRYVGAYSAGLFIEKNIEYHEKQIFPARFELRCTSGSTTFMAEELGAEASPFLGLSGNGFDLVWYQVPRSLPQGAETKCQLRVLDGGAKLSARFGKIEFYVQKQSDL